MQLEDYFDFIEPNIIRLKGHRIFMEHIIGRWLNGRSPEQIVQELPTLELEEVYGAVTYYLHNTASVDTYLERARNSGEEQMRAADANPDAVTLRLHELKERQRQERAHAHQ
jgi:uncharacterized protein (DUF433 family)